jgi:hypothetical protein
MNYVLLACRVLLITIFVVALVGKVRGRAAYTEFRRSVIEWRVLPRRWSAVVAAAAVTGEAVVVLLLMLPASVQVGFVAGALLLAAFTTGVIRMLRLGRPARCRCFGASTVTLSGAHVVRNAMLIGLCVTGAVAATGAGGSSLTVPGAVLALSAAAVGVLFVVRFDDLASVLKP